MRARVAIFGGNWTNGVNAGLSLWNLNNTSSNVNSNIGGRHLIEMIILLHSIFLSAC